VPAVGDAEWEGGWMSPLNAAIYPPGDERRAPEPATGCPTFKKDSVWRRPDSDPATRQTVCPGQFTFSIRLKPDPTGDGKPDPTGDEEPDPTDTSTSYSLTWWDPNALDLEVEPPPGIRRETLIVKDVPQSVLQEGRQDYEKWRSGLQSTVASGAVPSIVVRTATEWAAMPTTITAEIAELAEKNLSLGVLRPPLLPPIDQPGLFDDPLPGSPARAERPMAAIEIVNAQRGDRPGGARNVPPRNAVDAVAS
jgi:hypothetical protein